MSDELIQPLSFIPFWMDQLPTVIRDENIDSALALQGAAQQMKSYVGDVSLHQLGDGSIALKAGPIIADASGWRVGRLPPGSLPLASPISDDQGVGEFAVTQAIKKAAGAAPSPLLLNSPDAIANHIDVCSPKGVDIDFVSDYFECSKAVLGYVAMQSIVPSFGDNHIQSDKKLKAYRKMTLNEAPAIVISGYSASLEDGHHRYRVAEENKAESMLAYVSLDEDLEFGLLRKSSKGISPH